MRCGEGKCGKCGERGGRAGWMRSCLSASFLMSALTHSICSFAFSVGGLLFQFVVNWFGLFWVGTKSSVGVGCHCMFVYVRV